MKYILRNKNTECYLKEFKKIRLNHYTINKEEATIYNTTEVKTKLSKFKHPENWEVIKYETASKNIGK